jgi:ubiquinone/menaquinone biosynthesis C-methylase UbiE
VVFVLFCDGHAPESAGLGQAEGRNVKPQDEVKFFDGFVEEHGDYDVLGSGAYKRLLSRFSSLCKPRPHETCVDCGCGTGAFTRRLLRFELDLTGVDISPQSILSAQAQSTRENYMVGDITNLAMADLSVDIVVFSGVLHHFPDSQFRNRILCEAYRVLKPGGRVFGFDPSAHSPSMWLYRSPSSPFFSKIGKTDNEVLLSRDQLRSEFAQAGFQGISIRGAGGITYRYVEGRVARALLPIYNLYEELLNISPLQNRLGTFLISFGTKSPCL